MTPSDDAPGTQPGHSGRRRDRAAVWGAALGGIAGALVVVLLFLLAIVPPGQTVVFCSIGVGVLAGAWLCGRGSRRLLRAAVAGVGALFFAWGLLGIPALGDVGSEDGVCGVMVGVTVDRTYGGDRHPPSTSAAHPLTLPREGDVGWAIHGSLPSTTHEVSFAIDLGGVAVPVWSGTVLAEAPQDLWSGTVDLSDALDQARYATGFSVSGSLHVFATLTTQGEECSFDAYVRVPPEDPCAGPALIWTWVLLTLVTALFAREVRGPGPARMVD